MSLLAAVKFVSNAQRKAGITIDTHAIARYGYLVAFDGVLAAGCPIVETDLNCCPHIEKLKLALEQVGTEYQITQNEDSLFLRSGEFSAYIPLAEPSQLTVAVPDAPVAALNEAFRVAVQVCGSLVKDSAQTLMQSCIQLDNGFAISTSGSVIFQYWHGCSMPPALLIPKRFADALNKIKKPLASFGFSKKTFTVHFDDNSWLRTNLYQEKILSIESKLEKSDETIQFPPEFFEQASLVAKWSENGDVYLKDGLIHSHNPNTHPTCASYRSCEMELLPNNLIYNAAAIAAICKYAYSYDSSFGNLTMFYGDNLRGAIAHKQLYPVVTEYGHGFQRDESEREPWYCSSGHSEFMPDCADCDAE